VGVRLKVALPLPFAKRQLCARSRELFCRGKDNRNLNLPHDSMCGSERTYCKLPDEVKFRPKAVLIQKYVVKHYFKAFIL